jgi:hypothetical protein
VAVTAVRTTCNGPEYERLRARCERLARVVGAVLSAETYESQRDAAEYLSAEWAEASTGVHDMMTEYRDAVAGLRPGDLDLLP